MDCKTLKTVLEKYAENGLPDELRNEIAQHVAVCSSCAAYFYSYETVIRTLSGSENVNAPEGFREKILSMAKAERSVKRNSFRECFRKEIVEYAPSMAYIAAALIFVLLYPDIYNAASKGVKDTIQIYSGLANIYRQVFSGCMEVYYTIAISLLA